MCVPGSVLFRRARKGWIVCMEDYTAAPAGSLEIFLGFSLDFPWIFLV